MACIRKGIAPSYDDPSEIERFAGFPTAVQVWEEDRGEEIVLYYISPHRFISDSVADFVQEHEFRTRYHVPTDLGGLSSRYYDAAQSWMRFTNG